ncbi:MAG: peptidoglycan-binding protein [Ferrovibrio sp.]|uniref:peptidoglycan-binding protein n=1 Tax=Ferrovibrio sp. TaxID=1917215 RepID=UPI0026296FE8|nr:peptidoglycan-binding domain-containing protein [Ferrovibrio sp.]MCW0235409.1 peptidoglycan-binding protein [Ferrovibrio sp.]
MHNTALKLRTAISPDHVVEPADILDTKKALMTLGYYEPLDGAEPGAWVDSDLFAGIKQFQRDNGLKADALIRPGGPTEKALNEALDDVPPPPANDDQPPANDDETPWDEAAKGRYGLPWKGPPKKGPTQDEQDDHKPATPGGRPASECDRTYEEEMAECHSRYANNKVRRAMCQQAAHARYVACLANKTDRPQLPGRRR